MSIESPRIKNNRYQCTCCGDQVIFEPSLKERGMSVKTAQCLFVDAKAGMCSKCYVKHRSDQSVQLMRKIVSGG